MSPLRSISAGLRRFFRRAAVERELDDEVRHYLELATLQHVRAGMSHADAVRAARMQLRGIEAVKDEVRGAFWEARVESLWQDVRAGARSLRRSPAFAAVAALTLALGIGGAVAVFAVVDAVLLRPLPYPAADRVIVIGHHAPGMGLPVAGSSSGIVAAYQTWAKTLAAVALLDEEDVNLSTGETPSYVHTLITTPGFFDVIGVHPVRGRGFRDDDVGPGTAPVVVLTDAAWRNRFGARPDIVGQRIALNGRTSEIIGVMPQGFYYPTPATEFITPQAVDPRVLALFTGEALARLAPGTTLDAAAREVRALQQRLPERGGGFTEDFMRRAHWSVSVRPLRDARVGDARATLLIVFATVGFLLLIACANVANLFLVRAEARRREAAIRAALGATRLQLARWLLAESVWLSVLGGALGTAVAVLAVRLLVATGPPQLPRLYEVAVGPRALAFAIILSLLVGLLLAAVPLLRLLRTRSEDMQEGRGGTVNRERQRVRGTLVVAQVALALVLLVGSGLMLRTFQRLNAIDPGFEAENVLAIGVSFGGYDHPRAPAAFYQRVLDAVRSTPGVVVAGATNRLPIRPGGRNSGPFTIESARRSEDQLAATTNWIAILPGFFEALRVPLVSGRTASPTDAERRVVWVNETFARRFLAGRDPLHQRIVLGNGYATHPNAPWLEIAGVVGDVRTFGIDGNAEPVVYVPMAVAARIRNLDIGLAYLLVRTAGEPAALLPAVRSVVQGAEGGMPVTTARPMTQVVREDMADTSFILVVLGTAGITALLLASVGLYGVISYIVTQRTREIGVRLALGATPEDVRGMVMRQSVAAVGVGVGLGLVAAAGLTRLMASVLFEVQPWDPATFVAVVVVLSVVGMVAAYLPAYRASAVQPVSALRSE